MRKISAVKIALCLAFTSLAIFIFSAVYAADKPSKAQEEKKAVNVIVNINKASVDEIATLPGIGEKTAKLIIEYRDKNGSFKKIEDIRKVKGVGEKLFEKIKGNITVEDETGQKK